MINKHTLFYAIAEYFGFVLVKKTYKALRGKRLTFSELDLICEYFNTKRKRNGVMLDVGVHFGESFQFFLSKDWKIIGFEPDSTKHGKIRNVQKIKLYSNAVSDKDDENLDFYLSSESTGIASLNPFHESHEKSHKVTTITLKKVIQLEDINDVDFLKIDVEGFDLFALKGFPFEKIKPKIILVEFEDKKTKKLGYDYKDIGDFLRKYGYSVYMSEWNPIIKYGDQHSWNSITKYPCSTTSSNHWGNFIAIDINMLSHFEQTLNKYLEIVRN